MAVQKAKSYQDEGYKIVVAMDLSKFFDEVNHKRLMSRIMIKTPGEWQIHRLIHRYLTVGIMQDGTAKPRDRGPPQGSPLGPLLSNIVLDELDKELERRGQRFVRYAVDGNIYVKTQRSGERVNESIKHFLEKKMQFKVNESKSKVDRPIKRKFLGFSFYYKKGCMGIRVAEKSVKRLKEKFVEICKRGRRMDISVYIKESLNPCIRGWFNYYQIADMQTLSKDLDHWIRHRLRNIVWRQWKRNWTRFNQLQKFGLGEKHPARSAFNQRGPWLNSGSSHMNLALPKAHFDELGLFSLLARFMFLKQNI